MAEGGAAAETAAPGDPRGSSYDTALSKLSAAAGAAGGEQLQQDARAAAAAAWSSSSAASAAAAETVTTTGAYIDGLLQQHLERFHAEGALVHPAARRSDSGAGGPPAFAPPTLRQCMAMACDVKGFDYGIFWRLNRDGVLAFADGYVVGDGARPAGLDGAPGNAVQERPGECSDSVARALRTYFHTSRTIYAFPVGLGAVGRVAYTGAHEWIHDATELIAGQFHRRQVSEYAGIRSTLCLAVPGGVMEFGATRRLEESPATVHYCRQVCACALVAAQQQRQEEWQEERRRQQQQRHRGNNPDTPRLPAQDVWSTA